MKLKAAGSQNTMVYSLRDASSMSTMSYALCNAQHREQQYRSFGCRKIALDQGNGCLASDELVHAFRDDQYDEEESDVKEWTMSFGTVTLNIMVAWGFLVEMALKQVPGGARQKVQRISMGTVSTGEITGIVTPTHVCV